MDCPYCHSEMEKGVVKGFRAPELVWLPYNKRKKTFFALLADGAIPVGEEARIIGGAWAIAFNCKVCKKIIIEYDDKQMQS